MDWNRDEARSSTTDPISVTQFLDNLNYCGILSAEESPTLVSEYPDLKALAASRLAEVLVQQGRLTQFQVMMLLQGQPKELLLGNYLLLDKIGQSALGVRFKAKDRSTGAFVALLVLAPEVANNPSIFSQLERATKRAALLDHPNLVAVQDIDTDMGNSFVVMEDVEGMDLSNLVESRGHFAPTRAIDCILQAARGLKHAHEAGILHGDLQPSHLLLDAQGTIKILEIGLANVRPAAPLSAVDRDADSQRKSSSLLSTPQSPAAESSRASAEIDPQVDIHKLGRTLYFLLAGKPVEATPDLREVRPEIPEVLETLCHKLIAPIVQNRFFSMAEVIIDLESCIHRAEATAPALGNKATRSSILLSEEPRRAKPAAPLTNTDFQLEVPRKSTMRRRLLVAAEVVVYLLLVALLIQHDLRSDDDNAMDKPSLQQRLSKNSIGMELAEIAAGEFLMGADDESTEAPRHRVTISKPFHIGIHEVTQGEYTKVVGHNPSAQANDPNCPVENVTWKEAAEFCQLLSALPEEKNAGRCYRLPTEAEWEYACRAGTDSRFNCGDSLSSKQANFGGTGLAGEVEPLGKTMKVGGFAPNAWGLYDMHGNVREWCLDSPRVYSSAAVEDPHGDSSVTAKHTLRGGSWKQDASACRSSSRLALPLESRGSDIGFRVIWTNNHSQSSTAANNLSPVR